ncbi:histidine phosphatase family protein [Rhizobiaceae bacterium n13]|uniref:Histidine phosphatase family protein n=1 Tax=Ferirhizobium litorale TaxID=2927786 RepID=A0AAE3U348_9HYPH|nr:histidine phosphatase family protein [Fererhizobium litorale]MDI7863902.1 histidine phosphatase family protein [Fererhizobium litorale]MDI7924266.1 histidine phosphatase family protein [Fererhizobium litorale]
MTKISPPPFRIYLLRHAEAGWPAPGQRDFDRPLNDQGYAEAETVADIAADLGYKPELVLCSTAVRCRETADAFKRVASVDTEFRYVDQLYNANADTYLEILSAQTASRSVMIVGHNPTMEEVLVRLAGHDATREAVPRGFPTAGLAVLDWPQHQTTGTTVEWIVQDMLVIDEAVRPRQG